MDDHLVDCDDLIQLAPPPSKKTKTKKLKPNLSRALAMSYIRQTMTFLSEGEVTQHVRVEVDSNDHEVVVFACPCSTASSKLTKAILTRQKDSIFTHAESQLHKLCTFFLPRSWQW
jgi:hypothetical protein